MAGSKKGKKGPGKRAKASSGKKGAFAAPSGGRRPPARRPVRRPPAPRAALPPAPAAVREWPALEIFTQGQGAISRAAVGNEYGKAFASKATDELCQALATVRSFALEATGGQPRPVILEFEVKAPADADVAMRAVTLAGSASELPQKVVLLARRHVARDRFAQQVAAIKAQIEAHSRAIFPAGLEAMASPTTPSSVVESCWLNGTLRTYVDPRSLRDVADESTLNRLDLPRRLRAEIDTTASVVGAPQFRAASGVGGEHVTVAVIDAEADLNHPALAGRVLQKGNFTKERWGSPSPHGTAVAGIIASADARFTGMAPRLVIANYKVLATDGALNADDFGGALAIQQALEDGVQVANLSWGSIMAGDGMSREAVACNTAWNLGLVLVKSAGNHGPGGSTVTSPADADGVIVVGATDRDGRAVQDYSSRGPAGAKQRPHLVAPGGSSADPLHSCRVGGGLGDVGSGTSYAAPHVSGLAALLLAQNPRFTPDDVRERLLAACKLLPGVDANTQGKGLVSLA